MNFFFFLLCGYERVVEERLAVDQAACDRVATCCWRRRSDADR